jgi:uncharacterized protein (UPF0261 family)
VSELDVRLSPVDVIVSVCDMVPFARMVGRVLAVGAVQAAMADNKARNNSSASDVIGMGFNSSTLPLVYLKAKTLRFFLVKCSLLEHFEKENKASETQASL